MAERQPSTASAASRKDTPAEPPKRSLRWVRDVLNRSIRLEPRNGQLHVTLAEPPARVGVEPPGSVLTQQRAELGARLLVHDPATQPVKHLFRVHDALRADGWAAVEALPPKVVFRALIEAEILATDEPSPLLDSIIARLHVMKMAADEEAPLELIEPDWPAQQAPEVSETNFDEFEMMERSWMGTVPAGLSALDSRL